MRSTNEPVRTLILNAGSSSVKFRLYEAHSVIADGVVDGIGAESTLVSYELRGEHHEFSMQVHGYKEAGLLILGIVDTPPEAIVHRIVHGGRYAQPMLIDSTVLAELEQLVPLAPLHMVPALELIRLLQERTTAAHVAVFDTMFHQSMPEVASTYAIPPTVAKRDMIRRYGFHGIAYEAMADEAARLVSMPVPKLRIIACQLGNGASVCAIRGGRSIDTSMGFTPLEGLMMGTRSGDIDPAIIPFLCEHDSLSPHEVREMLLHESGLKALAGEWDVRKLLAREREGDKTAAFALDMFAYRVRKYIGAYTAALGGVDMIILSGGVSRAPKMRERILSGLEELGIVLDPKLLAAPMPAIISKGRVKVVVIEVDEQERMFALAQATLNGAKLAQNLPA